MAARGVTRHGSMRDWLGSKPPGSGGGGKFLSGWKDVKKGTGTIETWLHRDMLPMTSWRHSFPTIVVIDDKKTKAKVAHVWARPYTCHETEDVLGKLYWRETKGDPSSERTAPPERCGMCKFAEWLWQASWAWIESHTWDDEAKKWVEKRKGKGKGVDPCAVLFRFISEANDEENVTIHVGGYCGLFGRDELPDDLGKAMAAHKIRAKEAWRESCMVKPKSVMCVVDNANPDKGVQISEETKELGEKVKEEITRVLKSMDIDIQQRPYCIEWTFDRSKNMGKQYAATALMKVKPTDRILKLIRSEAPDLSSVETPYNQQAMRALHERHCKLDKGVVPWDEIFPSKEQEAKWAEEDKEAANDDANHDHGDDGSDEEDDATRGSEDRDSDTEGDNPADAHDDSGDEMVACDECGKPMAISAAKCPHCGHVYEVEAEEEEEEPQPPPKKMKTRAEIMAEKRAAEAKPAATKPKASAKEEKPKAKPAREPGDDSDEEGAGDDDEDGIPF